MFRNLDTTNLLAPVAVTGAFGFLGKRTIEGLLSAGIEDIVAFDLPGQDVPAHWPSTVRYVEGDVSNPSDVSLCMKDVKTVIHSAAMVGDWVPYHLHEKVTVQGSRYIFEEALKNDAKVVLVSSIVVYGTRLTSKPCDEDMRWGDWLGGYSRAKQEQEKLAWRYYQRRGMKLTVVRPANVYGAGSRPWVHDVIETLKLRVPSVVDGGNFEASLVHVDNVVQMLLLAAGSKDAIGQAFNGADGTPTTWKQYFSDLSAVLGLPEPKSIPLWLLSPVSNVMEGGWRIAGLQKRPPVTREALNLIRAKTVIPIDKARKILGYEPQVSYQQALAEITEYLKSI